jgi:hypothetical protein
VQVYVQNGVLKYLMTDMRFIGETAIVSAGLNQQLAANDELISLRNNAV